MLKITCPVCRGTGRSDFGLKPSPDNGCALCGNIGTIKLEPPKQALPLSMTEVALMEIRKSLLSVANPYIDVPQSVETVHAHVLDQIDQLLTVIRSAK
jgi:hypothetical protein